MSAFTVNPRNVDPRQWAAQMALSLYQYGPVPTLADPNQWREWARVVIAFPALAAVGAPRPEQFTSWQDWAHAFNWSVLRLS